MLYPVSIYQEGELTLPSSVQEQCMEVPASNIGGIFGITKEKCFNVVIPEQTISNVLIGGGNQIYTAAESELEGGSVVEIDAERFPTPRSIEDLQKTFVAFEATGLNIDIK